MIDLSPFAPIGIIGAVAIIAAVLYLSFRGSRVKYPTRCQIVAVEGGHVGALPTHTPEESRPHVGKLGTAFKVHYPSGSETVIVELDDGTLLHGSQCWWVPLENDADAPEPVAP
jgi:hypothetical protein